MVLRTELGSAGLLTGSELANKVLVHAAEGQFMNSFTAGWRKTLRFLPKEINSSKRMASEC
jgi:hypothetical protein